MKTLAIFGSFVFLAAATLLAKPVAHYSDEHDSAAVIIAYVFFMTGVVVTIIRIMILLFP